MEGEVGEDVGQKGSGQQGALSPLSPISPSLPFQLFSPAALGLQGFLPDTAEENPSGLNKTVFQDMQSLVFLFFPQEVEPTNGFFPKKKLILTVSSRFRGCRGWINIFGHLLKLKKFYLNLRKKIPSMEVAEPWNSCPRTFQTHPKNSGILQF